VPAATAIPAPIVHIKVVGGNLLNLIHQTRKITTTLRNRILEIIKWNNPSTEKLIV